jgi:hypothetical protein
MIQRVRDLEVAGIITADEAANKISTAEQEFEENGYGGWLSSNMLTKVVNVEGHAGFAAKSMNGAMNHGGRIGVIMSGIRSFDSRGDYRAKESSSVSPFSSLP